MCEQPCQGQTGIINSTKPSEWMHHIPLLSEHVKSKKQSSNMCNSNKTPSFTKASPDVSPKSKLKLPSLSCYSTIPYRVLMTRSSQHENPNLCKVSLVNNCDTKKLSFNDTHRESSNRPTTRYKNKDPVCPDEATIRQGQQANAMGALPGLDAAFSARNGSVLSSCNVLKRDLHEGLCPISTTGRIDGAPGFRMVPQFNVGTVAQVSSRGMQGILNHTCRSYTGVVVWVNLREEALILLHGEPYTVRMHSAPFEPYYNQGITSERMAEMEEILKGEVLLEAMHQGGNVEVCYESSGGLIQYQWMAASPDSVTTLADMAALTPCKAKLQVGVPPAPRAI